MNSICIHRTSVTVADCAIISIYIPANWNYHMARIFCGSKISQKAVFDIFLFSRKCSAHPHGIMGGA